jgi:hypothetical protein
MLILTFLGGVIILCTSGTARVTVSVVKISLKAKYAKLTNKILLYTIHPRIE